MNAKPRWSRTSLQDAALLARADAAAARGDAAELLLVVTFLLALAGEARDEDVDPRAERCTPLAYNREGWADRLRGIWKAELRMRAGRRAAERYLARGVIRSRGVA